jgi:hypothetical protein
MTEGPPSKKVPFDVTFLVGPNSQPIRAHKFVLAAVSDVFRSMFFSNFKSEDAIIINDIDEETFWIMLNCIYGRDFNITKENMVQVLYTSEKYNLLNLSKICTNFVTKSITASNALINLNKFSNFNNLVVNEMCLSIILDNPIRYFQSDAFVKLKPDTVRSIFKLPRLNCSVDEMKQALLAWLTHHQLTNGKKFDDETYAIIERPPLKLTKSDIDHKNLTENVRFRFKHTYLSTMTVTEYFSINFVTLRGIGILFGMEPKKLDKDKDSHVFSVTISRLMVGGGIEIFKKFKKTMYMSESKDNCFVHDVFFENFIVKLEPGEKLGITIIFSAIRQRAVYAINDGGENKHSVISHLIYSDLN